MAFHFGYRLRCWRCIYTVIEGMGAMCTHFTRWSPRNIENVTTLLVSIIMVLHFGKPEVDGYFDNASSCALTYTA